MRMKIDWIQTMMTCNVVIEICNTGPSRADVFVHRSTCTRSWTIIIHWPNVAYMSALSSMPISWYTPLEWVDERRFYIWQIFRVTYSLWISERWINQWPIIRGRWRKLLSSSVPAYSRLGAPLYRMLIHIASAFVCQTQQLCLSTDRYEDGNMISDIFIYLCIDW